MKKRTKKGLLSSALAFSMLMTPMQTATYTYAATTCELTYEFSGDNAATTGYAEGTITFTAPSAGTYYLYWADDTKALDNYYEITSMKMNSGESKSYTFGYHTAIPAKATKLIAVTDKSKLNVSDSVAVYSLPWEKQLANKGGNLLYTFNSYSDVHIDTEVYYTNSKTNWKNALKFAADMDTDFIVSSGDAVTNAKGFTEEWDVYEKILAESDYTKPVWETNGNHDMRDESSKDGQGVINGVKSYDYKGNLAFSKATGTDSTIANLSSNKPYYYVIEQNSGDLFIFMALENGHSPASYDNFSKEQINWLKDLLDTFYGTGINIYIIEHATFRGYGPGDIWTPKDNGYVSSYYSGHMYANGMKNSDGTTISGMDQNTEFKKLLETYKDVIWMSGHTHEDFSLGNNYTNENATACNMIHNPAVVGTTYINEKGKLEYDSNSTANDGKGLNSQGYYVEAYENHVVYYGANLTEEKIYPEYCYIMEGSRYSEPVTLTEDRNLIFPAHETLIPQKEVISADSDLTQALSITKNMLEKYYTYASYDQYQYLKKYYYDYKNNTVLADTKKAVANLKYASGQLYAIIHGNVSGGDDQPISSTHFALRYYSNGAHGWDAIDTYFSKKGNGLYIYTYTAPNTNDISVNVYDTTKSGYHCVAESVSTTFTDGLSEDYSLTGPTSSRGKSITIKGLNIGNQVTFLYNSNMNELTISFQASTDADVDAAIANTANNIPLHNLHKPVIDTTVTWDCVYYGNYPQTQITQENNRDVYNTLLTSKDWNENGDIIIGAEKYHRISKKDATSTALYTWEDSNVYHYFKYEPIKWRVLNVSDTEIYLLSDLVLDAQKMEQLPWTLDLENSTLQSWLNSSSKAMNDMEIDYSQNGFLNCAFTAEEQQHLLTSGNTNVNLLNLEEVSKNTAPDYGFISNDDRKSFSSDYAKAMGVFFDAEGYSKWWLLTNGEINVNALYVHTNGEITAKGVSLKSVQNGIRPAIHLRLENEPVYRYAGTVSSDGTQYLPTPTTTPTPSPTTIVTVSATPTPTGITSTPTPTVTPTVTPFITPTAAPTVTLTVTPTTAPITQIPATSTPAPTISPIIIVQPTNAALPTTALPVTVTVSPTNTPIIKKGTVYKDKKTKAIYKVTKTASKKAGTVQYVKPTNSNITTVTIPATIKINKKMYKVTSIAGKALQKKKKLKKVVIGKNVSSIGKNAFYGSKKLKLIEIKTTKLKAKKIGKNAFKGIHKKAKIIVPAKKQKAYEKILKSAGVKNSVKITH